MQGFSAMDMALYLAIQDEILRFNQKIHRDHVRPTVYRENKTFQVYYAFYESDVVWFETYELVQTHSSVHIRTPFIHDNVIACHSESEWAHLLEESGIQRNLHFSGNGEVTGKLVTKPLTKP